MGIRTPWPTPKIPHCTLYNRQRLPYLSAKIDKFNSQHLSEFQVNNDDDNEGKQKNKNNKKVSSEPLALIATFGFTTNRLN